MENTQNNLEISMAKMYLPAMMDMLNKDTIFDRMRERERSEKLEFISKYMTRFDKAAFSKFKSQKIKNLIIKKYKIYKERTDTEIMWRLYKHKRFLGEESKELGKPITLKVHYDR